jgi:HK97 gp10 family phage protein
MSGIEISDSGMWAIASSTIAAKQQQTANRLAAKLAALFTEQMLQNGQFDTGAMANSTYATTDQQSGYGAATSAAKGRNPDVELLGDVGPSDPGSASAAIAAAYAEPQNYGTSRLPARPFFEPAIEVIDGELEDALAQAWNELVDG